MARCIHALKQRQEAERRVLEKRIALRLALAEADRWDCAQRQVVWDLQQQQINTAMQFAYSPWYLGAIPGGF